MKMLSKVKCQLCLVTSSLVRYDQSFNYNYYVLILDIPYVKPTKKFNDPQKGKNSKEVLLIIGRRKIGFTGGRG